MSHRIKDRSCGTCSACCHTHSVLAVKTGFSEDCTHMCSGGGCAIYSDRPIACQVYKCWWLQGILRDGSRPNEIGVVVDDWGKVGGLLIVNFWEFVPGSLKTAQVQQLITIVLNMGAVLLYMQPREKGCTPYFPASVSEEDQEVIMGNLVDFINSKLG